MKRIVFLVTMLLFVAQAAQTPRVTLWTGFAAADFKNATLSNLLKSPDFRLPADKKEGTLETAPIIGRFDTVVLSWNGITPDKTSLLIEARGKLAGGWTKYYRIGLWTTDLGQLRRSYDRQSDKNANIDTDTISFSSLAEALQIRITFSSDTAGISPTLVALAAVLSDSNQHYQVVPTTSDKTAWGKDLNVPMRSQMIYPNGGRVWCSPTSTTMLLEYWSAKLGRKLADTVPEAVKYVWDSTYKGAGNWSFNVAYAGSKGLQAYVNRLGSLTEAEKYIAKGVPLILSIAWDEGRLDGAAIPSSNGHLLVLRGFTAAGDPIVNDPAAATDSEVRRVYKRAQLEKVWIEASGGIVYVTEPRP